MLLLNQSDINYTNLESLDNMYTIEIFKYIDYTGVYTLCPLFSPIPFALKAKEGNPSFLRLYHLDSVHC